MDLLQKQVPGNANSYHFTLFKRFQVIKKTHKKRGKVADNVLEKRLRHAEKTLQEKRHYDYAVDTSSNDYLESKIKPIIKSELK